MPYCVSVCCVLRGESVSLCVGVGSVLRGVRTSLRVGVDCVLRGVRIGGGDRERREERFTSVRALSCVSALVPVVHRCRPHAHI